MAFVLDLNIAKRGLRALLATGIVVLLAGAAPAYAQSPWWHLTSVSAPADLQSGNAKNEVQEIVTASEEVEGHPAFAFELSVGGASVETFATEPYSALTGFPEPTAANVQRALEGASAYGKGNVVVSETPAGSGRLIVTSAGEDAGRSVAPLEVTAVIGQAHAKIPTKGQADGSIVVTATDLGDASVDPEQGSVTLADKLPSGLKAVSIEAFARDIFSTRAIQHLECSLAQLSCTYARTAAFEELPAYLPIEMRIGVMVQPDATSGELNEAEIAGGGAPSASVKREIAVGGPPSFGVAAFEMAPEEDGGGLDTQAGSHPFQLTTTLLLNETAGPEPVALAKDLRFKLPPGLIGNPTPIPQCSLADFVSGRGALLAENLCPPQTAVGVARVNINPRAIIEPGSTTIPLFNLEPAVGEPARFGFSLPGAPVILDTSVRTGGDYGVDVTVSNISQTADLRSSEVTFWGVPGDPRHDNLRGWGCLNKTLEQQGFLTCDSEEANHPPPLLALPTSCTGALQTSVEADSWQQAGAFQSYSITEALPAMDGCNRLPFSPSISVAPDGQAGSTPTGLAVTVHVPQDVSLDAGGLSEADVKDTTVALPAGVGLNPAAADGLSACAEAQIALESAGPSSCPESSKVGLVKIKTPLLPNPLEGEAYLATQNANPFGSLVALYVLAEDPVSGTRVKLAGEVSPDPVTGQLISTFKNTPQLPFEDFELHFFGGDRAPLSTPASCGAYTTTASIAPWSGNDTVSSASTFNVLSGPNGSPCSSPLPFTPSLTAGTTSTQAGGFSPFTVTMSRPDGSQNLQAIRLRMPPGLLGTLASVKLCAEAQANAGTCGPESLIGHTTVSVGVGGDPYTVTGGEVFITEGYRGAPYGLSIVNPAKAGPFDLGKVIVRARIEVDPTTAALTITTDSDGPYKIPTILDGIPLQIQHVNVSIDRSRFTFNPTNCSPLAVTGNLTSDQGTTSAVSVPFQITNCAVLAFKPKLTAKTTGKTSRANGASLSVKLTYPAGPFDANIAKVKVDLPKQLPSRLTTLQKACPAATFEANPAACPAASIVGHAKATTPVIPVPLTGPAYFVSHGGEAFPSLIVVLQGYGATVHLVGATFIDKTGVTSSTFKNVPDVPVGTFELTLPQGKDSALAANGNLCKSKLMMPTAFQAQNGATIKQTNKIAVAGCTKAKKATRKAKQKHRAKAKSPKK